MHKLAAGHPFTLSDTQRMERMVTQTAERRLTYRTTR